MKVYFNLGFMSVPAYGCMIMLGTIIANLVAMVVLKRAKLVFEDFIIVEAYCFMGGYIGAKLLFFIVSYKDIDWSRITNLDYFNQLMRSGFVFYGGLIGGLLFVVLAGAIHKIDVGVYTRNFIFLIPMIHAFGRVGCFCAGCCYGIPYKGRLSVVFPEGSFAIPGIELFPVQLVEAILLLMVAFIILYLQMKHDCQYTVEIYLVLYAVIRFVLEYFRYDAARGFWGWFSTSQWISFAMILVAAVMAVVRRRAHRAVYFGCEEGQ